ncbi:MAG: MerR family transcriptional regulator [Alphaproteobacteria bacterium]|nr:MerR family transcriptional regulator [Alphaproteobacteria bacterium]
MLYTIGDVSEKTGLPAPTLRYYDKEGLLPFVNRGNGGIRKFQETDLEWLRLIECLKASGLQIKDIKRYIDLFVQGDSTIEERRQMFYTQKENVEQEIELLQGTLDLLTYKCWFYDTAIELGSTEAVKNLQENQIPAKIKKIKAKMKRFDCCGKKRQNRKSA